MDVFKCKLCDKEYNNYNSLVKHANRTHKLERRQFYVDYYLNGIWPICACGCGQKTKWSYTDKKFREFAGVGHLNKIRNNWGHNKKAQKKSSETRRKQYANGERKTWCDGLTLENSPSLQRAAKKLSERYTPELRKQYSEKMSKMRKDGTIPTLYRDRSSQWKGGVSSIQIVARNDKRLYEQWKYPILVRDGFKCTCCNNTTDLHVHHDGETFSEIIKKVMTLDDYEKIDNFETKKMITNKVIDYHIQNKVSGITLCKECHNNFHPSLNF